MKNKEKFKEKVEDYVSLYKIFEKGMSYGNEYYKGSSPVSSLKTTLENCCILIDEGQKIDYDKMEERYLEVDVEDRKVIFKLYTSTVQVFLTKDGFSKRKTDNQLIATAVYRDDIGKLVFYGKTGKPCKGKDILFFIFKYQQGYNKSKFRNVDEAIEKIKSENLFLNKNGFMDFIESIEGDSMEKVQGMIFYMNIYTYEPFIENIYKSGFCPYIKDVLFRQTSAVIGTQNIVDFTTIKCVKEFLSIFNKDGKNNSLSNILNCPQFILKKLMNPEYYNSLLGYISLLQKEGVADVITPNNIDIIFNFLNCCGKYHSNYKGWSPLNVVSELIDYGYSLDKLAPYSIKSLLKTSMGKTLLNNRGEDLSDFVIKLIHINTNYRDLLKLKENNSIKIDIDYVLEKYPKDILKVEQDIAEYMQLFSSPLTEAKFAESYEKNKHRDGVYGDYIIMSPKVPNDLTDEGKQMSHCVGGYINKYIQGSNIVYFLRKKDSPKTSYITFDIVNGRLNQYVMAHDAKVTDNDALIALTKWCKENKIKNSIHLEREEYMYA